MKTITDLLKHYSLDFRKGKTELQIRNFEKDYFENQEISFNAILDEIKVESTELEIWLSIPCVKEKVGETEYQDGLYYSVTIFENIRVVIRYLLSNDALKLSSFSKNETVLVKGLIAYMRDSFFSMTLLSIEKTDAIDQRPAIIRKLPEVGTTFYEYNKKYLKEKKEEAERKKGQCLIATTCYGNYDAPEVLVLRQYRDDKLLKTLGGKVFVKFYYSVSPFFATLISESDLLKRTLRLYFLEPIVKQIQHLNKR
jgi:hypothetical protein